MPEGFTLGDKFDTSKVEDMSYMFSACEMPEGFTLGNKFDTSKVKGMHDMFDNCKLPEGFTLGNKFDTSKVENMEGMFSECISSSVVFMKNLSQKEIIKQLQGGSDIVSEKDCKEKLINLLKEGKSFSEAVALLYADLISKTCDLADSSINATILNSSDVVFNKLKESCKNELPNMFAIAKNDTYSKYSVGEVRSLLIKRVILLI